MDKSTEVQTGILSELPMALREQLVRDIGKYAIALFGVKHSAADYPLNFMGSGTFVRVADSHYILTAAHVWRELKRFPYLALTLKEQQDHRCLINTSYVVDTTLGPDQPEEWGPDISFLRLPPLKIGTIEAHQGVFYNLSKRRDHALRTEPDINVGLWVLMGAPAASAELTSTHAALELMGGFTSIHEVHRRAGFDYLDVGADLSMPGVPPTFGGMSGGGLWQVLIERATGEFSSKHDGLNLEGVAFYESPPADGRRIIRCHGRRTIYEAMPGETVTPSRPGAARRRPKAGRA